MLTSNNSTTRVSQIWSTMQLKLDFPKCKDSYVPHNFTSHKVILNTGDNNMGMQTTCRYYHFGHVVRIVASCKEKAVLITAPPGMGKSRASEEIYTQLVIRGHFAIYVKLSQIISFWTKCSDTPSAKAFLLECMDDDKLQECPKGDKMIVVLDGFDEICPNFRSKVVTLIKELLVIGHKLLITSRPQEKDEIMKGLIQEVDMFIVEIEPFSLDQKVLMLKTRLNLKAYRLAKI
jgi:hypothetical protein